MRCATSQPFHPAARFYFPAYPYTGINHTSSGLADFRPEAWPGHVALWQSHMNAACLAAHDEASSWECMLANGSYPYVRSPVFITEAQSDQVVLTAHDWVPQAYVQLGPEQAYLGEWSHNMTSALAPAMASSRNGVFNAACFIHTSFSASAPRIDGLSYHDALRNWLFERPGPTHLMDHCGVMCNPTCPS
jgi:hypothetical protein